MLFKRKNEMRLTPASHVLSTTHGDRTILLDVDRGHYYGLDEIGSRIWALTAQGLAPAAIARRLADEYDAPLDAIAADVAHFVAGLRRSKLLEET